MNTTLLKNSYWRPGLDFDEHGNEVLIDGIEVPITNLISGESLFVKGEEFTLVGPYDTDNISTCYYYVIRDKDGVEYTAFASDFKEIYEEGN